MGNKPVFHSERLFVILLSPTGGHPCRRTPHRAPGFSEDNWGSSVPFLEEEAQARPQGRGDLVIAGSPGRKPKTDLKKSVVPVTSLLGTRTTTTASPSPTSF